MFSFSSMNMFHEDVQVWNGDPDPRDPLPGCAIARRFENVHLSLSFSCTRIYEFGVPQHFAALLKNMDIDRDFI